MLRRACLREDDGSVLIEFALSSSVLFGLLFCFMELCLVSYSHELISELAREGTRYAVVRGATCPNSASPTCEASTTSVNSYVAGSALPNLAGGAITVATTYPDGNEAVGSRVQVKVSYSFKTTLPFVPAKTSAMTSTSVAYIVQ